MNVTLPPRTPVNLYAATGIAVGTVLKTVNNSSGLIRLYATENEPTTSDDSYPLIFGCCCNEVTNDATDLGAWALCVEGGSIIVEEA